MGNPLCAAGKTQRSQFLVATPERSKPGPAGGRWPSGNPSPNHWGPSRGGARAGGGSAAASVPGWREAAALNCKIDLLTGRCEQRQMESSAAGAHLRGAAASIPAPSETRWSWSFLLGSLPLAGPRSAEPRRLCVYGGSAPYPHLLLAPRPRLHPHGWQALPAPLPQLARGGRADAWQRPAADEARAGLISM